MADAKKITECRLVLVEVSEATRAYLQPSTHCEKRSIKYIIYGGSQVRMKLHWMPKRTKFLKDHKVTEEIMGLQTDLKTEVEKGDLSSDVFPNTTAYLARSH